jgi:hypothetical protein
MGENAIRLPKLIRETGEAYRSRRNQYMTSHQLADFRKSPLLHKQKSAGLIAESTGEAYTVGATAHCLILEGRKAFDEQYIVGGPINEKTGRPYGYETKAFRVWAEQQTRKVISDDNYALICHLNASVHSHDEAAILLKNGTPEGVLRASYGGVDCQIRMDWFSDEVGIVDLKTCYDLDKFEIDCEGYRYVPQMAFYRAILNLSVGRDPRDDHWPVTLIAVEKCEPYRCGVWLISSEKLLIEEHRNAAALVELRHYRSLGNWPTRYEAIRIL